MRSRGSRIRRLFGLAVRALGRDAVSGMAGLGMAYGVFPPPVMWGDPSWPHPQADPACLPGPAELDVAAPVGADRSAALSRRERKQWAALVRQLR